MKCFKRVQNRRGHESLRENVDVQPVTFWRHRIVRRNRLFSDRASREVRRRRGFAVPRAVMHEMMHALAGALRIRRRRRSVAGGGDGDGAGGGSTEAEGRGDDGATQLATRNNARMLTRRYISYSGVS